MLAIKVRANNFVSKHLYINIIVWKNMVLKKQELNFYIQTVKKSLKTYIMQ